jgi:hypothetical protein
VQARGRALLGEALAKSRIGDGERDVALGVRRREFIEAEDLVTIDRGPGGAVVDEDQLMIRLRMQPGAG